MLSRCHAPPPALPPTVALMGDTLSLGIQRRPLSESVSAPGFGSAPVINEGGQFDPLMRQFQLQQQQILLQGQQMQQRYLEQQQRCGVGVCVCVVWGVLGAATKVWCDMCGGCLEHQQRCGVGVCGGCLEHQQRCGLGVCGGGVIGATSRVELNLGV